MLAWRSTVLANRTRRIGPKTFVLFRKIDENSDDSMSGNIFDAISARLSSKLPRWTPTSDTRSSRKTSPILLCRWFRRWSWHRRRFCALFLIVRRWFLRFVTTVLVSILSFLASKCRYLSFWSMLLFTIVSIFDNGTSISADEFQGHTVLIRFWADQTHVFLICISFPEYHQVGSYSSINSMSSHPVSKSWTSSFRRPIDNKSA